MTVTIHGIYKSRAFRVLVAAEAMGVPVAQADMGFGPAGSQSEAFRKINPYGAVPALTEGDFALAETAAIILYLAKNHAQGWYPSDPKEEARLWQWSFFAYTDLERPQINLSQHTVMLAEEKRVPAIADTAREQLKRVYGHIDACLDATGYLSGDKRGLADLMVGTVAFTPVFMKWDLSAYPRMKAWLDGLAALPGVAKLIEKRNAS